MISNVIKIIYQENNMKFMKEILIRQEIIKKKEKREKPMKM